jgi:TolB-like protein/Tfp pilus assembly protein PilF
LERRLAAILAADVVGYTRLMGADETGTLRRLTELRQQVLEPLIAEHHGRVVKLIGDGLLVEFASVVDALTCAVAWQDGVAAREAETDEDRRFQFRIGINLGDVIVEGDDIHGDGVNIAARIEGQAEPGGICLSGDAYRQAKGKVKVDFEDLGERDLKNVAEPVRIYRIAGDGSGLAGAAPAKAPLALPDKPSIAVLPFANMSGDKEQEYFSDGITEDVITELSRFRELFVIARNSSFSYKGKAVKVQDIATDLGVRYVLEGSVRAAGDRIRVTAQLIDAETGHHIWSERYNREITDLFALQDEIAQTVAGTVAGRLKLTAEDRAERKPIESLEAYDYALRGQSIIADTKENNLRARQAYEKAIELDPMLTMAYVGLARSYVIEWFNHWWDSADAPLDPARDYAAKAVSLDNTDSKAHLILGHVYEERREYEEAKVHLERALELNPNDADALALMGTFLQTTRRPREAIDSYLKAMRLNPYYPAWYVWKLGSAYFAVREYENALIPLKEALNRNPKFKRARLALAATYAQLDRIEEAGRQVEELLADHPDASIRQELQLDTSDEEREHWLEGLRRAGLPE